VAEFIRIVRVRPNGSEQLIRDIPIASLTDSQTERAEAFAEARTRRDGGVRIRVYTSSNEQVTPDDLVWDSTVNL
jgi:hypothetical protein